MRDDPATNPTPHRHRRAVAGIALLLAAHLPIGAAFAQGSASPFGAPGATAVRRVEYLARAADCVSRHAAPGGAPFAGGYRIDHPLAR